MLPAASPQLAPGLASRKPQVSIRVEALLAKTSYGKVRASKAALALASTALVLGGMAAIPFAPVGIAVPPVPVVSASRMRASAPAIARARVSPPPVIPASFEKPRRHSRPISGAAGLRASLRRAPVISPAAPVLAAEGIEAATVQQPVAAYVVVSVTADQEGWIQIVWFRVARAAVLNQI
jgi:hypothetical protein